MIKEIQSHADWQRMHAIYMQSFPPEERRDWDEIRRLAASGGPITALGIYTGGDATADGGRVGEEPRKGQEGDGALVGFFTLWDLGPMHYVEHFAIDAQRRGAGVGARALEDLARGYACGKPIMVEVEREEAGADARRRIGFYQRCGFAAYPEYDYIQPPYGPELPPVPLMLMATGPINPAEADALLRQKVYCAD